MPLATFEIFNGSTRTQCWSIETGRNRPRDYSANTCNLVSLPKALRRLTWNFSSSAGAVIAGGYLVSSLKGTSKAFPGVHAGQTDVFPLPLGPDAGHTRHHGSHSAQSDRLRISLQRPDGARLLSATWSIGIIFGEYLKVSKRPLLEPSWTFECCANHRSPAT